MFSERVSVHRTGRPVRRDSWSEGVEYLNPDEVARDRFGDWNSPDASRRAAEWCEHRREALLAAGAGIAFESVFSQPDKVAFVQRACAAGYFVRVFFVSTSSPRINASRVARRVMRGGHTVPIEKIVSRYARSMSNLSRVIPSAQRVYVFDNSVEDQDARLCVRVTEGRIRKVYGALPFWVQDAIAGVPWHDTAEDLRGGEAGR